MNLDSSLIKQFLKELRRTSATLLTIKAQILKTKKTTNQTQILVKQIVKKLISQTPNLLEDLTIREGEKGINNNIYTLNSEIYN